MILLDEIEQLCQMYKSSSNNEEKEKLREILTAKQEELSSLLTKCNISISKINNLLNPPKPPGEMYNVYNI